ncbi:MAG: hypothetical protein FWG63_03270 [Defluviitaleaceae bacterium]|nr:hypothetical protein [Defluviitaleaceae bacterium]
MVNIEEYDKVKLKNGEMARIVEVYEAGVLYEAEIFRPSNGFSVTVDTVKHEDIVSVFKEIEYPLVSAS